MDAEEEHCNRARNHPVNVWLRGLNIPALIASGDRRVLIFTAAASKLGLDMFIFMAETKELSSGTWNSCNNHEYSLLKNYSTKRQIFRGSSVSRSYIFGFCFDLFRLYFIAAAVSILAFLSTVASVVAAAVFAVCSLVPVNYLDHLWWADFTSFCGQERNR